MMPRRTVIDEDGTRYLLLKQSEDASLVRELETGTRQHIPTANLEPVDDVSTVESILTPFPEPVQTVITAVHDRQAFALLQELDVDGPTAVTTLLSEYEYCERELHGLLAEFQAAGLVTEVTVTGTRGYRTTDTATTALRHLREVPDN